MFVYCWWIHLTCVGSIFLSTNQLTNNDNAWNNNKNKYTGKGKGTGITKRKPTALLLLLCYS